MASVLLQLSTESFQVKPTCTITILNFMLSEVASVRKTSYLARIVADCRVVTGTLHHDTSLGNCRIQVNPLGFQSLVGRWW